MKKILIVIAVLILLMAGGAYYWMNSGGAMPNASYTLEQIAEHGSKEDCWIGIEGKVYDVTEYVGSGFHPGKEAILKGCGKDATSLFNNRPNGSGAHSEMARNILKRYLIGTIKQ